VASSAYASHTDVLGTTGYLRDPNSTANAAILDTLCNVASRFIDQMSGQHFYDDGYYFQPYDSQGMSHIDPSRPFFFSSGTIASASKGATSLTYTASALAPSAPQTNDSITLDIGPLRETLVISNVAGTGPYTLTVPATGFAHAASTLATTLQVELAYFENQPLAQRILTLDGDGVTPPSNMLAWPRFRPRVGAANQSTADNTSRWPWKGIDISHIPISNTTFLPSSIPGYQTVRMAAHWGWPVVPDLIKDLTCKYAARLWRMRQAGEADVGGTGIIGTPSTHLHFDPSDEALLLSSDLKVVYI
jgi:hypothetical protein